MKLGAASLTSVSRKCIVLAPLTQLITTDAEKHLEAGHLPKAAEIVVPNRLPCARWANKVGPKVDRDTWTPSSGPLLIQLGGLPCERSLPEGGPGVQNSSMAVASPSTRLKW